MERLKQITTEVEKRFEELHNKYAKQSEVKYDAPGFTRQLSSLLLEALPKEVGPEQQRLEIALDLILQEIHYPKPQIVGPDTAQYGYAGDAYICYASTSQALALAKDRIRLSRLIAEQQFWKELFCTYKEVHYFPSPLYKRILDLACGAITTVSETPEGQNIIFRDNEAITYFYDFFLLFPEGPSAPASLSAAVKESESPPAASVAAMFGPYTNLYEEENEVLEKNRSILVYRARHDKTGIGEKLEELIGSGQRVTHLACAREVYGGDTHYSTWREYQKIDIYELSPQEAK